nr:hypothetical protein [uncultured Halomonas sp.]
MKVIVLGIEEADVEPLIVSPGAGLEGFFSRQELPLNQITEGIALVTAQGNPLTGRYRCGDEQRNQQRSEGRVHEATAALASSTG